MSDSLLNKGAVVINAIAITTAFAVLSGQLPLNLNSLSQMPSALQSQLAHVNPLH